MYIKYKLTFQGENPIPHQILNKIKHTYWSYKLWKQKSQTSQYNLVRLILGFFQCLINFTSYQWSLAHYTQKVLICVAMKIHIETFIFFLYFYLFLFLESRTEEETRQSHGVRGTFSLHHFWILAFQGMSKYTKQLILSKLYTKVKGLLSKLTVVLLLLPAVLNGSVPAVTKGSVEDCLKKQSAAKGSEPLKGSPPKGSKK